MLNYIKRYFDTTPKENLLEYFPHRILDIIGQNGENNLRKNKIVWKPLWMGQTDYIDRIFVDELENNFSYGVDHYNRSFIFVKVGKSVIVIFQRYSDDKNMYVAINPDGLIYDKIIRGRCYIDNEFHQELKEYISKHVA
jgi:hypothetical protein